MSAADRVEELGELPVLPLTVRLEFQGSDQKIPIEFLLTFAFSPKQTFSGAQWGSYSPEGL